MNQAVVERLKEKIKSIPANCGVPRAEMVRAVYAIFVSDYGKDAVGDLELYRYKPNGYWTLERCKESAAKFSTRSNWYNGEMSAYGVAKSNGWLDECCAHMTSVMRPSGYWTLERCKEDAMRFSTKSQWKSGAPASHASACKNKWLDECCAHMVSKYKPDGYWTLELCKEDALRFTTKVDWSKSGGGAHHAAYKNGWVEECCAHMPPPPALLSSYSFEDCKKSASNYTKKNEWKYAEYGPYKAAKNNGWYEECTAHMVSRNRPAGYWTYEVCKESASKHKTKASWMNENGGAYSAASKNGWLEDICKHFTGGKLPDGYWTLERCKEEALRFPTRSTWQKGSQKSYSAALRFGYLEECCAHMPKLKNQYCNKG